MGIFDNIFRRTTPKEAIHFREADTPGVPSSTMPKEEGRSISGGSFSERIVYARSPQVALSVSAVYRATELRAKTIGVMPVQYQKKDFAGGNYTTDMRGLGKRINYLLQEEPNPIMSASSLWELVTINRLMTGNGFVYIERDEFGFPMYLWLVKTGAYNIATGRYASIVYLSDDGYITKTDVPREDVLHFPNTFRLQNGFWGISTLQFALETLSLHKTEKQLALETAAKGGRIKGFISEEKAPNFQGTLASGQFSKPEAQNYAKELQDKMYSGQDILAIQGLEKFQNISMTAQDMQMMDILGMTSDDVARFWATPRPLLMLDTNSHYNDYQNATMEFHTRTILPDKTDMEKEIARKLIGFNDYGVRRIHICEKPLLAMDPERQAKVDQLNLQTGAMTVNEIRANHDMPAVNKGDIVYVSTNLAELGSPKLSGESSTELKPGNYTVKEPTTKEGEEQ